MNGFGYFIVKCFNLIYPVKVYGKENLKNNDSAIICCNHFRAIDPAYSLNAVHKNTYILAKKEIFNNKLLGKILKWLGAIPVDRDGADLKSLMNCVKLLKSGKKLIIYPEGTRNKTGTDEIQELKGGASFLALKTKSPIYPVILSGKGKPFRRVKVYVGNPYTLDAYYDKKLDKDQILELDQLLKEKMIEAQKELKEILSKRKKGKDARN